MGNSLANHYTIARMGAKTKIVCTLGPACSTPEALRALVEAGMDAARVNFSHGTPESNRRLIRIGELPEEGVELTAGQTVRLAAEGGFSPHGPVETLVMMRRIADAVEANLGLDRGWLPADGGEDSPAEAVARAACRSANPDRGGYAAGVHPPGTFTGVGRARPVPAAFRE